MRTKIAALCISLSVMIFLSMPVHAQPVNAGNYRSAIAYDPVNDRHLVVFEKFDGALFTVYGRLLNNEGVQQGGEITIYTTGSATETSPHVTYDSTGTRFLVVWHEHSGISTSQILGRFVDADGTVAAASLSIASESSAAGDLLTPKVAYDQANDQFLVIWNDNSGATAVVAGEILDSSGANLTAVTVSNNLSSTKTNNPSVAFDSTNKRYLVVWSDDRDGAADLNIYGQIVNASNGALLYTTSDTNFVVSNFTTNQTNPAVSFDSTNKRYLVVWQDSRNVATLDDIYGQLVNIDGALIGANIAMVNNANTQQQPDLIFDRANGRYLLVWSDNRDNATKGWEIYGSMRKSDGTLYSAEYNISNDSDITMQEYRPSVSYGQRTSHFVVAYEKTNGAAANDIVHTYAGKVWVSPGAYDFGYVTMKSESILAAFIITNKNTGSITVSNVAITGANPGDFVIKSNPCIGTLTAGNTCTVSVVAKPQSSGVRTGVVTFTTSDTTTPAVSSAVTVNGNEDSSGISCFIATAAFGSYLDPRVRVLREFRDRYLVTNAPGRFAVRLYYRYSPPVADYIREHEQLRTVVRWGLTPVVYAAEYPAAAGLALLCAGLVYVRTTRKRKAQGVRA